MFGNATIKKKLFGAGWLISALILILVVAVWQGVRYVSHKTEAVSILEQGANHLQTLSRGVNEVALTESSSTSLLLAKTSAESIDQDIQQLNLSFAGTPQHQLLLEKIEPEWNSVNRQVAEYLQLDNIGVQNDEAMLKLGSITAAIDALLGEIYSMAEIARADAKTSVRVTVMVVGGVALAIFLIVHSLFYFLYRGIVSSLNQAVTIAARVASGDLTTRIGAHTNDEIGLLLSALEKMNQSLQNIVENARISAREVMTTAQELAVGNGALSERTEQQAASLEETTTNMEELTTTVQKNSEGSKRAQQLAVNTNDIAEKGGETMSKVVDTMNLIDVSSKKIVNIISVMEGITFQTNILALNAAVEAARAGEKGRGFAVVAHEVRELAQRSARAAQEIKTLINDSEQQINVGAVLVKDAGKAMDEIIASVNNLSGLISQISSSSSGQSNDIMQVSRAIALMEGVTQDNAKLAQDTTVAAGALEKQAARLSEVVGVFTLGAVESVLPANSAAVEAYAKSKADNTVVINSPAPRRVQLRIGRDVH